MIADEVLVQGNRAVPPVERGRHIGRVDNEGIVLRTPQPPVAGGLVFKGDHLPAAPGPQQDKIAAVRIAGQLP